MPAIEPTGHRWLCLPLIIASVYVAAFAVVLIIGRLL